MRLFFRDLVRVLSSEHRTWRNNTVIFYDNAPSNKLTIELMRELNIPIMFTGPYSYDASPCESWFALFKKVNINPRKLGTGKG